MEIAGFTIGYDCDGLCLYHKVADSLHRVPILCDATNIESAFKYFLWITK